MQYGYLQMQDVFLRLSSRIIPKRQLQMPSCRSLVPPYLFHRIQAILHP
jgi:hypothetical protein